MRMGASSGLHAWILQRFSAIYMSGFTCYAVISYMTRETSNYHSWIVWVVHPVNHIAIGLFILSMLVHAWVGSRDIVLDYVKPFVLRMTKLAVLAFLLIAMGLWAFRVLLNVAAI